MKRICQGKYEILTTKEEAIDKFMNCRVFARLVKNNSPLWFYCSEKGNITITNPPTRHIQKKIPKY